MGDRQARAAAQRRLERRPDERLIARVERGRRLVEDEQARIAQGDAGQALPLAPESLYPRSRTSGSASGIPLTGHHHMTKLVMMTVTAIAELKAHLSSYLKQVKAGQEIIVTERGRPVAKLVPIAPGEAREERRDALAAAGLLRLGRGRIRKSLFAFPASAEPVEGVVDALIAERDEGR